MELRDLVDAVLCGDLLSARQWVADAQRGALRWKQVVRPAGLDSRQLAVAAGLAELLAARAGAEPPDWTLGVGAASEPVLLDPGLERMPRTFHHARTAGPEPLRKRNLVALPDFLDVR